jgi:hypothetical protein
MKILKNSFLILGGAHEFELIPPQLNALYFALTFFVLDGVVKKKEKKTKRLS